ncbi:2Fe-2S iron-sulfur cluster binding domain-containing protein [Nocardia sp. ET3-3]|uniref:2Fe-2S iron-sulfur cluster binding domain-containing protein n=1 Tax=Nocardia terrae TaxID=2675851 RepID=A0A7K1UPD9_9NOCA|nr:ferredoxin reductase [Nocardia terrae]MVU76039.1 2Fe-2S iron-sulfur cluster binding domain-containing protein [Nocardia terrae]
MVGLIDLVQKTMTTPHPLDRYLELVRPTLVQRSMRAEITHVRRSAVGSVTLTLKPGRQWSGHVAGQYIQIGVVIDGVRHTRCYSPVNADGRRDRHIELTIKAHPHGLVSNYLHENAIPGMVVDLEPAAGVFHLPPHRPDEIVLISGGSGITPVLSMLRTLANEGYRGRILFLHYNRSPEWVPHRQELEAIAMQHGNVRVEFRYPETQRDANFGYDELENLAPWFASAQTYLCGPPGLMAAVRKVYEAEQLGDRLHSEEFTLATTVIDPADAEGKVTFSGSGVVAENTGETLLDQAESAGLSPQHGCRMGICFTCTAVKRSGCTRNLRTGELDSDPDQPIQICINAPVGDVDIEI